MGPITGILRKNWTMVPKKSPNNPKMPASSNINPINACFIRIKAIPAKKHIVPRILLGRLKNESVRSGPMIRMMPIKKRMLPRARSPRSKRVIIPRKKKKMPPAVNPTPNSNVSHFKEK